MKRSRRSWSGSMLFALLIAQSGCTTTRYVTAECPKFEPSPEALQKFEGTAWKDTARRVIEYYRENPLRSPDPSPTPSKN